MEEKKKLVFKWLNEIYGSEYKDISFEVNANTIEILNRIRLNYGKRKDACELLLNNNVNMKLRNEYLMKENQERKLLENVGLDNRNEMMNNSSLKYLNIIVNIALLLNLRFTKLANFISVISEISNEEFAIQFKVDDLKYKYEQTIEQSREYIELLNGLEKFYEDWKSSSDSKLSLVQSQIQNLDYFKAKNKEYQITLKKLKLILDRSGYKSNISHDTLIELKNELESLKNDIKPLKEEIANYKNLPPDETLAKVKISEAKQNLERLEKELSEKVASIDL